MADGMTTDIEEIRRFLREDVRSVGFGVVCAGPPATYTTAWGVIALGDATPSDEWLISAETAWQAAWSAGDWDSRVLTIADTDALIEKYGRTGETIPCA